MDAQFWHDKWARMEIGFHLADANPWLVKHWSRLALANEARVLVPLCGKSFDLLWLRRQGHAVVGIELSELALDELAALFHEQLGITLKKFAVGDAWRYEGDGVTLIAGDFFQVMATDIGPIDAVYDRAALVALPSSMRADYCQHLLTISGCAPQLLISFDYQQALMAGPPFAVLHDELIAHYGAHYVLQLLEQRDLIEQEEKFRERGLSSFVQTAYALAPALTAK
ncbi:MAG: thiopurine S-methyltransferase [Bacterioplanes sp.]|nr:thiopurine S-methyltransferase [Bacterioplanes sp.]